jgi:hypothetical protein
VLVEKLLTLGPTLTEGVVQTVTVDVMVEVQVMVTVCVTGGVGVAVAAGAEVGELPQPWKAKKPREMKTGMNTNNRNFVKRASALYFQQRQSTLITKNKKGQAYILHFDNGSKFTQNLNGPV